VQVTAISGSTYTISPGLYGVRWNSGHTPFAWWANTFIQNAGVEDLHLDNSQNGAYNGIAFQNAANCWVKGVASNWACSATCSSSIGRNHIWSLYLTHLTIQDSYLYATLFSTSESYGVES
jgi:hypothetical protein